MADETTREQIERIHDALARAHHTLFLLDGWPRSPQIWQRQITEAINACRQAMSDTAELAGRLADDGLADGGLVDGEAAGKRHERGGTGGIAAVRASGVPDLTSLGHDVWVCSNDASSES